MEKDSRKEKTSAKCLRKKKICTDVVRCVVPPAFCKLYIRNVQIALPVLYRKVKKTPKTGVFLANGLGFRTEQIQTTQTCCGSTAVVFNFSKILFEPCWMLPALLTLTPGVSITDDPWYQGGEHQRDDRHTARVLLSVPFPCLSFMRRTLPIKLIRVHICAIPFGFYLHPSCADGCDGQYPKIGEFKKCKFSFFHKNNSMSTSFGKKFVTL